MVAEEVRSAMKTQNSALETHFDRIDSVTRQMQQEKRVLNLQNGLFYFGSLFNYLHGNDVRFFVLVHSKHERNLQAESQTNHVKQPNRPYAKREMLASIPMQ